MDEIKLNKTYHLVKALNNGLYNDYLKGDIVLQDIADRFEVSFQHVSAVIKQNNIGHPSEEKRMYNDEERILIKKDIDNGIPIECFQTKYKLFENINDSMNVFNTITRWTKSNHFKTEIPYITVSKLNKFILDVNIMKFLKINNMMPKNSKMRLTDIADNFEVSYSKVSNINSYLNKSVNNLLPDKNEDLVKVIIRNLEIVNYINFNNNKNADALHNASEKYFVDIYTIEQILDCESYQDGSNLYDYLDNRLTI